MSESNKPEEENVFGVKYVGYFDLYGLGLHLEKKPCWFHRTMMRILLGSEWKDAH